MGSGSWPSPRFVGCSPNGARLRRSDRRCAGPRGTAFPGIVTRVDRDGLVGVVEILAGPHRIVSLMTAEAVDEMELREGDEAIAVVKATNVIIEVPSSREART